MKFIVGIVDRTLNGKASKRSDLKACRDEGILHPRTLTYCFAPDYNCATWPGQKSIALSQVILRASCAPSNQSHVSKRKSAAAMDRARHRGRCLSGVHKIRGTSLIDERMRRPSQHC